MGGGRSMGGAWWWVDVVVGASRRMFHETILHLRRVSRNNFSHIEVAMNTFNGYTGFMRRFCYFGPGG